MSKLKLHISNLFIIAVLVLILGFVLKRPEKVITETKYLTDTTFVERIDTVEVTKVVEVEKKIVDTTYITVRDSILVPIPMSEYRFFQKGLYDITAYGYNVSLSNIIVFPKTVYQTVTNTVEKEVVVKQKPSLFASVGIDHISGEFSPNVGLFLSWDSRWILGAKVGIYANNACYGVCVGYNVLSK